LSIVYIKDVGHEKGHWGKDIYSHGSMTQEWRDRERERQRERETEREPFKRRMLLLKRQWIMSKESIAITILDHYHKPLEPYLQQLSRKFGSHSAVKNPILLWNPKVHYYVLKDLPPTPILSSKAISLSSILILFFHLHLGPPNSLFSSGFPTNVLYAFFISPCVLHIINAESTSNQEANLRIK
jgi:hypothetical protein